MSSAMSSPHQVPIGRDGRPVAYEENGRFYSTFSKGEHWFPIDEQAMMAMDIFHRFFLYARDHRLHATPLAGAEAAILDVGTGSGIWSIDVADEYIKSPQVERIKVSVLGIDTIPFQPPTIPPNLSFMHTDFELPSPRITAASWHLIHVRALSGRVVSWPRLYSTLANYLKPREGCMEQIELDMVPRCDDGTLPPDAATRLVFHELNTVMDMVGRPLRIDPDKHRSLMHAAGLCDIRQEIVKIPFNGWPGDEQSLKLGSWFSLAMVHGLEGLCMAPFTRVRRYTPDQVHRLVTQALAEIMNRRVHTYCYLYVWTARRP